MTSKETKKKKKDKQEINPEGEYCLVLHNDDIHSFDYVTDALIEICEHSYEQAMQCTLITHHKGSCEIRKGTLEKLKQMKEAFSLKDLITTIN